MNAILLIAHAPLANALRQCALHVFPDCGSWIVAIDVQPNLSPDETLGSARIALDQLTHLPQVKGVLVLTDIFGATPSNVAQKLVDGVTSRLITGVNLPMLLRSVSARAACDACPPPAPRGGPPRRPAARGPPPPPPGGGRGPPGGGGGGGG